MAGVQALASRGISVPMDLRHAQHQARISVPVDYASFLESLQLTRVRSVVGRGRLGGRPSANAKAVGDWLRMPSLGTSALLALESYSCLPCWMMICCLTMGSHHKMVLVVKYQWLVM